MRCTSSQLAKMNGMCWIGFHSFRNVASRRRQVFSKDETSRIFIHILTSDFDCLGYINHR